MFNPLGAMFGTMVGAGKGMVEGFEEGLKTGNRGSIFDVVTVPVGAATGAVTGSYVGTVAGVARSIEHDYKVLTNPSKRVEWSPMAYAKRTCDLMDNRPWCKDIVRPVTKVTNAAAIGGSCAALGGAAVGAASVSACAGSGAVAGALREVDALMRR